MTGVSNEFHLINNFKQFFQTGLALHRLQYPIFPHEHEVSLTSCVDYLSGARSSADELADILREAHDFIDTDSSLVSSHPTRFTSLGSVQCIGVFFCGESCDTDILEHPPDDIHLTDICFIGLDTVGTETTHEALRDDNIET